MNVESGSLTTGALSLRIPHKADECGGDFERRLDESQRMVFAVAYAVLGSRADAEDVAQEALLRAFHKRATLREPEAFRSWVARAAYRLSLNSLRRRSRAQVRDEAAARARAGAIEDPQALAAARIDEQRLRAAIARLPDKLRAVIVLTAIDDLNVRAVGAILRIPEGTVRSRLHLARKQLLRMIPI